MGGMLESSLEKTICHSSEDMSPLGSTNQQEGTCPTSKPARVWLGEIGPVASDSRVGLNQISQLTNPGASLSAATPTTRPIPPALT